MGLFSIDVEELVSSINRVQKALNKSDREAITCLNKELVMYGLRPVSGLKLVAIRKFLKAHREELLKVSIAYQK